MLRRDRFDLLIFALLLGCVLVLGLLLLKGQAPTGSGARIDKALEQQIAYQARINFLQNLYQPVEQLRQNGQLAAALLKLDELARKYPQEAHGEILRGEILLKRKAVKQAIDHFVRAVRLNGDYVDQASPLSRYPEIQDLVEDQLPAFRQRAKSNPQSQSLQNTLTGLYYLQSRLAGGCE